MVWNVKFFFSIRTDSSLFCSIFPSFFYLSLPHPCFLVFFFRISASFIFFQCSSCHHGVILARLLFVFAAAVARFFCSHLWFYCTILIGLISHGEIAYSFSRDFLALTSATLFRLAGVWEWNQRISWQGPDYSAQHIFKI